MTAIYAQRVDGRRELLAAGADGSFKRFAFTATDEAWLITETTYPAFGEGRLTVAHRRYRRGLPVGMVQCTVCLGHGQVVAGPPAGPREPFACPNCIGRGQVPAARDRTVTDVPTGVLWICGDCCHMEACGECDEPSETYPPLGELDGMRLTLGMAWDEHADGCDNRAAEQWVSECNCEVITFHAWGCPTCGNPDHGERHAATGWWRVVDVWTDTARRAERELRDSHTVVSEDDMVTAARDLLGGSSNPEYFRALVELTCSAFGLDSDEHRDRIGALITTPV